jgi:hypothetical protein
LAAWLGRFLVSLSRNTIFSFIYTGRVAENVTYTQFKDGHQLAEECSEILSKQYLSFSSVSLSD